MNVVDKKTGMPYWQKIVAVLTVGWIVIWIYRTVLTPIYPIISDYFGGATDSQLGSISSFYFLGYGVFNFFGMTASVIVPSLTGTISDITGSKVYAFYLAIGIILVGTLIFSLVNKFVKAPTESY